MTKGLAKLVPVAPRWFIPRAGAELSLRDTVAGLVGTRTVTKPRTELVKRAGVRWSPSFQTARSRGGSLRQSFSMISRIAGYPLG